MRLPVVIILLCYIILIFTGLLIVSDLRKLSLYSAYGRPEKKRRRWWIVFTVFEILVAALLTVAISLPRRSPSAGIGPVMWMLYTVMTIELSQLIYSVFSLLGLIPVIFGKRRWNTALWIGLPLGVMVFSMMWWGVLVGRFKIRTEEVTITSTKLPESFNGYRIAQISDLHVGTWGNDTVFLSRLVDKVNALQPDLIVFTGDIVNRDSRELKPFISVLGRLSAPDGVLTVLGNHDYGDYVAWSSPKAKRENLEQLKNYEGMMGWKMLDNASSVITNSKGDSIIVIGVGNWGEPPFSQYGNLKKAYPSEKLNDENYKILLSHNPEHWNQEVSQISNIDLTLAGHTHAMQMMFSLGNWRWSPSQYKYEQWAGLYNRENSRGEETKVYVNIGAGEVGIPMRIGADPEITLFELRRAEK